MSDDYKSARAEIVNAQPFTSVSASLRYVDQEQRHHQAPELLVRSFLMKHRSGLRGPDDPQQVINLGEAEFACDFLIDIIRDLRNGNHSLLELVDALKVKESEWGAKFGVQQRIIDDYRDQLDSLRQEGEELKRTGENLKRQMRRVKATANRRK